MATIHNTKFIKADSRVPDPMIDGRAYISAGSDDIMIRDTYIAAGGASIMTATKNRQNIFIPLVGSIAFAHHNSSEITLSPGDLYLCADQFSRSITVRNTLPADTINFLQIILPLAQDISVLPSVVSLDIKIKNRLLSGSGPAECIRVGVYDGRAEDTAPLGMTGSAMMVYIINGSFEVDGRLMEHRDALLVWDTDSIEYEALSEAAIILLIEFSPSK